MTYCSDCPPEGYPTDETRCNDCPRRVPLGRSELFYDKVARTIVPIVNPSKHRRCLPKGECAHCDAYGDDPMMPRRKLCPLYLRRLLLGSLRMTNTPRALLIEDYQAKCAKMEDDMLGWKESAEAWERDARGLSDRLKMLEALAREPGSAFDSVERILDDESAWVSRPSEAVSLRIALAAMMIAERKMKLEFAPLIEALCLILPMAKGYAAEHPVGSNMRYVIDAELLLGGFDTSERMRAP